MPQGLDAAWNTMVSKTVPWVPRTKRYLQHAQAVVDIEQQFNHLSDARLREAADELRILFRLGKEMPDDVTRAFAVVCEAAWRQMDMRPYLVQIAAGMAILDGCVVEMATGEGKTLSATMPAAIAGWRGRGCHVITVNDYLAQRDAEWMTPVYKSLGLTVAHVINEMPPPLRRDSYLADITYGTNKEIAADVLRDRLAMGRIIGLPKVLLGKMVDGVTGGLDRLVMRGIEFAIVDEADSILVDEAVTPLIISGSSPNEQQVESYIQATDLARQLESGRDYTVDHRFREVRFTRAGRNRLHDLSADLGGLWAGTRRSEEIVTQAVTARDLYQLDKQYVIQDDKVVIVDEFTGRLMPDRNWRDGLHQAVEAKEGVEVTPPKDTLARISFQRFFRMYRRLSGMTGTAAEAQHELWQVYHLPVVRVPTNRPCIRTYETDHIYADVESKWQAIVQHIRQVHETGRPILVGTRSVGASEMLSSMLQQVGLEHKVLNAVRHREEANIVAGAGQGGCITVATNMAGRGTDIKLGRSVAGKGGLHVIATERHEDGRIDRQLFGRAARQGDPGSAVAFNAINDELILRHAPKWAKRVINRLAGSGKKLAGSMPRRLTHQAQLRAARMAFRQRKAVLKTDDWLDEYLGFAGAES